MKAIFGYYHLEFFCILVLVFWYLAYSNVSHKPVKSDHYIDDGLDNQFPTNVINSRPKIPPFGKRGARGDFLTPFENPPISPFFKLVLTHNRGRWTQGVHEDVARREHS